MAFANTVQDLSDRLTRKLLNLAISHSLPIQPALGLLIFRDSFQGGKNVNAFIEQDDNSQTLDITCGWYSVREGKAFNFSANFRYDEIFRGRSVFNYGSVGALYGTSKNFFDEARDSLPAGMNTPFWEKLMDDLHNEVAGNINTNLTREVRYRKENLFTDMSRKCPTEQRGKLMEKVLADYDLELYERSLKAYEKVPREGQIVRPETLLESWRKLSDTRLPGPASFEEFFWGVYLFELVKAKRYPLNVETDDPFKLLIMQREDAVKKLGYKS